jgi:tRNA pseudouridine55 synthase
MRLRKPPLQFLQYNVPTVPAARSAYLPKPLRSHLFEVSPRHSKLRSMKDGFSRLETFENFRQIWIVALCHSRCLPHYASIQSRRCMNSWERNAGIAVNGLLVLDKPAGMTSHDVVDIVRRATGERSVGHLGTLDPMATGVLPVLLGKYTRLAQFFSTAEKTYEGSIRFGYATDTFDAEGTPASEASPLPHSLEQLRALAARFQGEMQQLPPVFSAKKIGGVPAHKLARAGKPVEVKPARIFIHRFELLSLDGPSPTEQCARFIMQVSAGGYVRSVAHELGQLAGCGAHLAALRRTQAGSFTLAQAISLEQLKSLAGKTGEIESNLPHPRTLLPEMPSVTVDDQTAGRLRNGMQINLPDFSGAPLVKVFTSPTELLGIAKRVAGTLMQPTVILG